jgi:hypothetical protein
MARSEGMVPHAEKRISIIAAVSADFAIIRFIGKRYKNQVVKSAIIMLRYSPVVFLIGE